MPRPNPDRKTKKSPILQYVIIGILIVIIIVALYYAFFLGATDRFEQQEDPATLEQSISHKSYSPTDTFIKSKDFYV